MNQVTLAGAEGGGDVAYACDFYCLNTNPTDIFGASNANVSFLGDVGIYATMPVQDGVVTWQPVPSVPQSYVNVNSIPPQDDNAYVYTDTINNGETFLFQPILGFNGTIFGAQLVIYAKKDAEGTRAFKPAIAGSTFVGPSIPDNYLFDYYDYFTFPMDSNNGVAWTPANFNSQNFGAVLTV
jgi:hypothetical protein